MTHRGRIRTAEGAWYRDYYEYKPSFGIPGQRSNHVQHQSGFLSDRGDYRYLQQRDATHSTPREAYPAYNDRQVYSKSSDRDAYPGFSGRDVYPKISDRREHPAYPEGEARQADTDRRITFERRISDADQEPYASHSERDRDGEAFPHNAYRDRDKERELYRLYTERQGGSHRDPDIVMTDYEKNRGLGSMPPLYDHHRFQEEQRQMELQEQQRQREKAAAAYHYPTNDGYNAGRYDNASGGAGPAEHFSPRRQGDPPAQQGPASQRHLPPWERPEALAGRDQYPPASPSKPLQPWDSHRDREDRERERSDFLSGKDPLTLKQVTPWGREAERGGHSYRDRISYLSVMEGSQQSMGAFLFIRFPLSRGENYHVTAKACLHAKTSDLKGRFFGIARKVWDYGYKTSQDEGCVVFQFPSLQNAEIFYHRDKHFRQHDFPAPHGHAEIFAISLQCDPNNIHEYNTFLLSDIILKDGLGEDSLRNYRERFRNDFAQFLCDKCQALPYAAYCTRREQRLSLRRRFFGTNSLMSLHLFRCLEDLEDAMKDPQYAALRSVHNGIAEEKCSVFKIDRALCP